MKHISVVLYDIDTKTFIEHECMEDGEILLSTSWNDGMINILMSVAEISLELKIYSIVSRRFSIDKNRLILNVKLKNI